MPLEQDIIFDDKAIKRLAKNYNTLDYYTKLQELLRSVCPSIQLETLSKYELHKILNDILFSNYNGEEILKYKLCEQYWNKSNVIGAFEINVNSSRLDFLAVNGTTTSFEIKSELDNLSKLKKQIKDYSAVFEYNNLVIAQSHVNKVRAIIPKGYGLWSYENGKYKILDKASRNTNIDPESQLKLFTKKELSAAFPESSPNVGIVLKEQDSESINKQFKRMLKDRYRSRWEFVTNNSQHILPIDIQFFFQANIDSHHVYVR